MWVTAPIWPFGRVPPRALPLFGIVGCWPLRGRFPPQVGQQSRSCVASAAEVRKGILSHVRREFLGQAPAFCINDAHPLKTANGLLDSQFGSFKVSLVYSGNQCTVGKIHVGKRVWPNRSPAV